MIITDVIGIMLVDDHNPISDTISALAIEKYAWVQDIGLELYAVALKRKHKVAKSQRKHKASNTAKLCFLLHITYIKLL